MKKLALSSLIAVFAVSGAHAANVINDNPLYMPTANHFYSVTDVSSHTKKYAADEDYAGQKKLNSWKVNEEFGYGVTDRFTVNVATALNEHDTFRFASLDDLKLGMAFRALDKGAWKLDLIGKYGVDTVWKHPRPTEDGVLQDAWFDKDLTLYTWTAGVRGGYTTSKFTVAGKALFNYTNTESFNWDERKGLQGMHELVLGVDGMYALCDKLSLVAGVQYTGRLDSNDRGNPDDPVKNEGEWTGTFGVDYNIDATKYVGLYVRGDMNHKGGVNQDEWKEQDGFGFGAKFGIDF